MLTIDIFTTPKPFKGLTARHQANALRSWRAGAQVGEIFVFGETSGDTASIEATGAEVITDVAVTDNGLPSIRGMFERAAERSNADLLMFTNADMIYLSEFFSDVSDCAGQTGENFLLVGSRMDFDCEQDLKFQGEEGETEFLKFVEKTGSMHPPAGSDYFIFPREQYLEHRLPDLWIGRAGWDLYMIYHAKQNDFATVDLSSSVWGYHQNHDYSNRGEEGAPHYLEDPEASYNLSLLPEGAAWKNWTLHGCEFNWEDGALQEKPIKKKPAKAGRKEPKSAISLRLRSAKRSIKNLVSSPPRKTPSKKAAPKKKRAARDFRKVIRDSIRDRSGQGLEINIVVGAADTEFDEWISTNIQTLNLLKQADWESLFGEARLDRVLAEHVWEHLSADDGKQGLQNVFSFLKPGGRVRIAVPDGHFPDPEYLDYVRVGGSGPGADDHKMLYTVETLSKVLEDVGFESVPLEYFDASGEFHKNDWSEADGSVRRSAEHDPRNVDGEIKYSSLIVDGVKPSRKAVSAK